MKNTILILLLLSTAIISCSKKNVDQTTTVKIEKEKVVTPKKSDIDSKDELETPAPITPTVLLMAKINRTPCFGKCPVFTI